MVWSFNSLQRLIILLLSSKQYLGELFVLYDKYDKADENVISSIVLL